MARDGRRHEAHGPAGRDQSQDLQDTRALGGDASRKPVTALLGEPPGRPGAVIADGRIREEALLGELGERQRLTRGEWMRGGQRDAQEPGR
jgi:hypothetical protein